METSKLQSCIQLIRRLPPSKIEHNVQGITNIIYEEDDLLNEFLQKIDQPAEVGLDDKSGEFLKCEYNRDGESYR